MILWVNIRVRSPPSWNPVFGTTWLRFSSRLRFRTQARNPVGPWPVYIWSKFGDVRGRQNWRLHPTDERAIPLEMLKISITEMCLKMSHLSNCLQIHLQEDTQNQAWRHPSVRKEWIQNKSKPHSKFSGCVWNGWKWIAAVFTAPSESPWAGSNSGSDSAIFGGNNNFLACCWWNFKCVRFEQPLCAIRTGFGGGKWRTGSIDR